MRPRYVLSFSLLILITSFKLQAQEADTVLIEKTVLNYIENFFENKFEAMNESLHPRLAKRGLNIDRTMSDDFPPSGLKKLMESKQAFPVSAQKNKVTQIKVFRNVATATLVTGYPRTRWVEFIHLTKIDGKWKIINVFWEFFDK
ncbi:MAG: nuclear transport factor 2 family protein [Roseivirga sp.]|nr:nuclear transport factor 2 family protein [Roseivirga sp.]